jgi:hypothetical protein
MQIGGLWLHFTAHRLLIVCRCVHELSSQFLKKAWTEEAVIDLAVTQLVGSYYALAIAGEPIPPHWPERVVDQVLTGLLHNGPEH